MNALVSAAPIAFAVLLLVPAADTPIAQELTLRIAAPTETTYLSGPSKLVAIIEPQSRLSEVRQVIFFADGKQVCAVTRPPFNCDWDAGDHVIEHVIRVVAEVANEPRLVENVRTQGVVVTEAVDVDVVQVTVVVSDGNRFVRGLQQKDFRIYDDDREQKISNFADEKLPLDLVVAIDMSMSMKGSLEAVKEAAKSFLAGLKPSDQVTLLGFNDNITTLARRTTDKEYLAHAIDRLAPWGGTALYDVTIGALDLLGRQKGRRSVDLFTDGDDQSSHATLDAAIARAESSDATIYAIGQGRAVRASDLQDLLQRLARISGGRAFFPPDANKVQKDFEDILEDLRNQYMISYPVPDNRRDGAWHRIRIEVAGGKYQVRARQRYQFSARH
jgi:Ca-activated chloride channel family protein